MKNREREVEMMLKAGRQVLDALDGGNADEKMVRQMCEAIRVHNTTLRTEVAIEKLKRTSIAARRAA